MNKHLIATMAAVWITIGAAPFSYGQGEGNTPAVITNVTWEISRNIFGNPFGPFLPFEAFDPAVDNARETDVIRATVTIFDPDFDGEDGDEVFILRQSIGGLVFGFPTPEPPPIPEDDEEFQPEEGDGLKPPAGQTTLDVQLLFTIPTWIGKNQARLRGLIDFDVFWLIRFIVSNDQDPGCETDVFGFIIECDEPVFIWDELVFAVEHPELAPPNPPPFADAGPDQTVAVDSMVALNGDRSFDAFNLGFDFNSEEIFEKDVLVYAWEWISGPVRVEPTQANPNDPIATVPLSELGTYVYRLTVDDNFNTLPSTDSITINVVSEIPENRPPRAVITGSVSPIVQGSIITLDGSTSSDPDNDLLAFLWRQTALPRPARRRLRSPPWRCRPSLRR